MTFTSSLTVIIKDAPAQFFIEPGEWIGDTITFSFKDERFAVTGRIEFNAATAAYEVHTDQPYPAALPAQDQAAYFANIVAGFTPPYRYGWNPTQEQMPTYDHHYHQSVGYQHGAPEEVAAKTVHASIIKRLANPQKLLVAGCSNGELIRSCRIQGVNTWGFDLMPGLSEHVYPEVKPYVREGSLSQIPFTAADGFDTLVATDVLEHVPERDVQTMIAQWQRLDLRQLVLLINLNQWNYPGHVTLRPLDWWARQWQEFFKPDSVARIFNDLPTVYGNDGDYNHQWVLWQSTHSK